MTRGIYFYDAIELGVYETIYIVFKGVPESDIDSDAAVTYQIEMIAGICRQIRCEVESEQTIAIFESFSRNAITLIEKVHTCATEKRVIRFHKQVIFEIWLQLTGWNLYTVNTEREIVYVKMFKIEWVGRTISIVCLIFHETADDSSRNGPHENVVNRFAENAAV